MEARGKQSLLKCFLYFSAVRGGFSLYSYHFSQWLMFFYLYCFAGWIIESTIVSVSRRKLVNRGFLRGPYLPLYGTGAIAILFIALPFQKNPVAVYFGGMIGATVLEYVTGCAMEAIFKMKYWDYSKNKWNLHGRICLKSSLFWGVLAVALVEWIHPPVERLVLRMDHTLLIALDLAIFCLMAADTVVAVRTALDLNKLLAKLTQIKSEADRLRVEIVQRRERDMAAQRAKLEKLRKELNSLTERAGFWKSQLVKAHPSARSKNFDEALGILRGRISERRKRRKDEKDVK